MIAHRLLILLGIMAHSVFAWVVIAGIVVAVILDWRR